MSSAPPPPPDFTVEIPGGGSTKLATAGEVELWNTTTDAYLKEFGLSKVNDLQALGVILHYRLHIHRVQQDMGDPKKMAAASATIIKLSADMREIEKSLGIDKKSREAGGQHTITEYLDKLRRSAHEKGIHISERVRAYEALAMELRWKIRMLRNSDAEDRRHHDISEKSIIDNLERALAELEEQDKTWAREKAHIWVGKL